MRRSLRILASQLLLLAALSAGLWWLAESPVALRWAADRVESAFDGRLRITGLSGSLRRGLQAEQALYERETVQVRLEKLQIAWSLRTLLSKSLHIASLTVERVSVSVAPDDDVSAAWPQSLALPVQLHVAKARIDAITFRLRDYTPLAVSNVSLSYAGSAETHAFDVARIELPWGPISAQLQIDTQRAANQGFPGTVAIRNDIAGPWSAGRIPLVSAAGNFTLAENMLAVDGIDADLGQAGKARGNAKLTDGYGTFSLDVSSLDLHAIYADLATTALRGRVDGELDAAAQRFIAQLAGNGVDLRIDATLQARAIDVAQLSVAQDTATLEGTGRIELDGAQPFSADLRFNGIDPSVIVAMPPARLRGAAQVGGTLSPAWSVSGNFDLRESTFLDLVLSARGVFSADGQRVSTRTTVSHSGGGTLRLDGAIGGREDRLNFNLAVPAAEKIDRRLQGRLNAQGTIDGALTQPRMRMNFSGESVALGGVQVSTLSGTLNGTQNQHVATLRAAGETFEADMRVDGALLGGGWVGSIRYFENRGRYAMQLSAPVQIRIGPGELNMGATGLEGFGGSLRIGHLRYSNGRLDTTGEFSGVPASILLALAGTDTGDVDISVRLGGSWRIVATPRLNGEFLIERESGDIVLVGAQNLPLRLRKVSIEGAIRDDHLSVTGQLTSAGLAEGRLIFSAMPVAGARAPALGLNSPVQGQLDLNLPALREFGPLTGIAARFSGKGALTLIATGTLGNPELTGSLAADELRVSAPRHSVFLTDGRARVALADRDIRVAELSIRGGAGRLIAASRIAQRQSGDIATLDWRAENFRLLASPTRYLVLEGSGSLALQGRQPVARGELRVREALFSADTFDTVRLSDDVVIAGSDRTDGPRRDEPLPIDADISFDFGNNFRIREAGIDVTLGGRLRVHTNAAGELLAEGTVNILRGTYIVYGQTLNIENGRLYFDGPADNPRLDITAMRRNMAVEAGVRITGTAQEPRVQLVSDPPVPDIDIMSWLVFGRPASDGSRADFAFVAMAAEAFLAGPNGVPVTTRVARRIGADHVGLRSRDGETDAVILGRRLTNRIYVFLQQGISTADSVLIVEYTLARNWRARAEAGDVAGLGLVWGRFFE